MKRNPFSFLLCLLAAFLLPSTTAQALQNPKDFVQRLEGTIAAGGGNQSPVQTTTSISQHGITWTFDKEYLAGQFANGDFWVKTDDTTDRVTITSMSPDTTTYEVIGRGTYVVNGWQVNPGTTGQAFDQRGNGWNANLLPSTPYNASGGESIAKSRSRLEQCLNNEPLCKPMLQTIAVLTVVDQVPPDNGVTIFRPPYVGKDKPMRSVSEIRWDRIPSLAPVANMPTLQWVVNAVGKPQADHKREWNQQHRPSDNLPFYGANINQVHGDAVLRIMMDDSRDNKKAAVIAVLQGGIDYYHFIVEGQTWPRSGGEQPGRILLPLFASYILDDSAMQSVFPVVTNDNFPYETHVLKRNKEGVVLWGDANPDIPTYWNQMYGSVAGASTLADPYGFIDGGGKMGSAFVPGGGYQSCCTSQGFKQTTLIMELVPALKTIWPFQELIDYAERWVTHGAWTQPDPCAPPSRGGGHNPETGMCILDPNLAYFNNRDDFACKEGLECGRFPELHGVSTDAGDRYSDFAAAVWNREMYSQRRLFRNVRISEVEP